MFQKILLIISIALGLIISGCASFSDDFERHYDALPFFMGFGQKTDCLQNANGSVFRVRNARLCSFEQWGY
ncbi:MAG: hypothetical protein QX194_06075 [Methylococcales bacterium]